MAVEVFKGKFVTASDASQFIDIETIMSGCSSLKQVSEKLDSTSAKIDRLRELCSKDALSIDEVGCDEAIEVYEKNIKDFSLYIDDLASTIRESTQRVVNRKQVMLNEEAKRLESKAVAEEKIEALSGKIDVIHEESEVILDNNDVIKEWISNE